MTPEAERFNGWAAMLGFVAAVGAYVTTGQIIPGWFQDNHTGKPKAINVKKPLFLNYVPIQIRIFIKSFLQNTEKFNYI